MADDIKSDFVWDGMSERPLTYEEFHARSFVKEEAPAPKEVGVKHDANKVRMELLPQYSLEEVAKVLTFGADKYGPWNWAKGIDYSRLQGALLRHYGAFARGEDKDPESGLPHLAHLGACVMFLLYMNKFRPDLDDRHRDPAITPVKTEGEATDGI